MTKFSFDGGTVRGVHDRGTHRFGCIAYAEPALGGDRFRLPRLRRMAGDIDASQLGPSLPQLPCFGAVGAVYSTKVASSAGALTLNVRTPELGAAGLPVLVWIHGGGFAVGAGSDPTYQGGAFARDGIVEVTINHRLGVEGFAYVDDPQRGTVANLGLHDHHAVVVGHQGNPVLQGDKGRVVQLRHLVAGAAREQHAMLVIILVEFDRGDPQLHIRGFIRQVFGDGLHAVDEDGVDLALTRDHVGHRIGRLLRLVDGAEGVPIDEKRHEGPDQQRQHDQEFGHHKTVFLVAESADLAGKGGHALSPDAQSGSLTKIEAATIW